MDRLQIAERIQKVINDNPVNGKPLSSYQLAEMKIISSSTLSSILRGKVRPSAHTLAKLADYYNISVEWLMTGKDPEPVQDDPSGKVYLDIIQKLSRSLEARDNEIERLHKIIESALCGASPTHDN